jgi:hypothetical protein
VIADEVVDAPAQDVEMTPAPEVKKPPRARRMTVAERRQVLLSALAIQSSGAGTEREAVERGIRRLRAAGIRATRQEIEEILAFRVGTILAPPCLCPVRERDAGRDRELSDPEPGAQHERTCPRWRPL